MRTWTWSALVMLAGTAGGLGKRSAIAYGQARAGIVGTWLTRTADTDVKAAFAVDGRYTYSLRGPKANETSAGTYRLEAGTLELRTDAGEVLRLSLRFLDPNTIQVTDAEGNGYRMVRQGEGPRRGGTPLPTIYRMYRHIDRGGIKHYGTGQFVEAFRMLAPDGWRFQGGIEWLLHRISPVYLTRDDLLNPAKVAFTITSPDGRVAMQVYPQQNFSDLRGAPAAQMEYKAGEITYRETFTVCMRYLQMPGITMWNAVFCVSGRAPADELENWISPMLVCMYSFRFNTYWALEYLKLVDRAFRVIRATDANIRRIDDQITRSRAETNAKIMRQMYPRLAPFATFVGPDGRTGFLPTNTDYHVNENGDVAAGEKPDGPGWRPVQEAAP